MNVGTSSKPNNNFDLLRLVLAIAVMLDHSYWITRLPEFEIFAHLLSDHLAVKGFFIISGYLVVASWLGKPDVMNFWEKRVRRILPGYIVMLIIVMLSGAMITTLPINEYIGKDLFRYFTWNTLLLNFLEPNLPGVFVENPKSQINGSLWTLKIEFAFYLTLPLIMLAMNKFGVWKTAITLYILSMIYAYITGTFAEESRLWRQLEAQYPAHISLFITGMVLRIKRKLFLQHWIACTVLAIAAIAIQIAADINLLYPIALGILLIGFALKLPYLGNAAKHGDLSYGIFLWHWPTLQVAVHFNFFETTNPWLALPITIFSILLLAWLSWHIAEKGFLLKSSHYIKTEEKL